MLQLDSCRQRQQRLLRILAQNGIDLAVLANPRTIYYLTGALVDHAQPHAFLLSSRSLLITNQQPRQAAADEVRLYTGYTLERIFSRTTMVEELVALARDFVAAGRVAAEVEFVPLALARVLPDQTQNLTPILQEMRRHKDADELAAIRATIALTESAYAALRARLEPGMTEFEAYSILYEAIVQQARTSVHFSGDFACGTRAINGGGPPTARAVQPGDLYILDLFPIYEGYMCDLCRTFAAGQPSELQRDAWAHIIAAHELARKLIRPGAPGREVYQAVRSHLEEFAPCRGSFNHHLGHGLGMDGWEFPWLTPGSDQVIQEGDVIACEPGLYGENLQGGIRLEHNYLVRGDGAVVLDSFPMEMR